MKTPPNKPDYTCLGVITGARGIKGEVTVKSFCQNPADIVTYGPLYSLKDKIFTPKSHGKSTKTLFVKFEEVADRNAAEILRGTYLYAPISALPEAREGEYYYQDLLKLPVISVTGDEIGIVAHVFDSGAHTMLEVKHTSGQEIALPLVDEYVAEVEDQVILTKSADELVSALLSD